MERAICTEGCNLGLAALGCQFGEGGTKGAGTSYRDNEENTFPGNAHLCLKKKKLEKDSKAMKQGMQRYKSEHQMGASGNCKLLCSVSICRYCEWRGPELASGDKPVTASMPCKRGWTLPCKLQ